MATKVNYIIFTKFNFFIMKTDKHNGILCFLAFEFRFDSHVITCWKKRTTMFCVNTYAISCLCKRMNECCDKNLNTLKVLNPLRCNGIPKCKRIQLEEETLTFGRLWTTSFFRARDDKINANWMLNNAFSLLNEEFYCLLSKCVTLIKMFI